MFEGNIILQARTNKEFTKCFLGQPPYTKAHQIGLDKYDETTVLLGVEEVYKKDKTIVDTFNEEFLKFLWESSDYYFIGIGYLLCYFRLKDKGRITYTLDFENISKSMYDLLNYYKGNLIADDTYEALLGINDMIFNIYGINLLD